MATSGQIQGVGIQQTTSSTLANGILGKDDFLKMLVSELRHQDPMNPMNGTEFAAQLAQFSSVEQLANINTSLSDSIAVNQLLTQAVSNTMSAALIGRGVRATASSFQFAGGTDVKFGYTLPSAAKSVVVKVYNENNQLVRTITGGTGKGDQTITWDGKDEHGNSVTAGAYHFAVEALDAKGATLRTSQFIYGTVTAVRFKSTGTVFVIDGAEIPLSDILEIMKG